MSGSTQQMAFEFGRDLLGRIGRSRKSQKAKDPGIPVVHEGAAAGLKFDAALEDEARVLLRLAGCEELARSVRVGWNSRMRTTAGTACWRTRRVTLNPKLIEFSTEEVQRTLRHELAHLVAQERVGRRRIAPHGPEWRQACADLGIADETRCHTLPFKPRRMTRKYAYRCPVCSTVISRVRRPRGRIACLQCCRQHNGGRYSERFRFELVAGGADATVNSTDTSGG